MICNVTAPGDVVKVSFAARRRCSCRWWTPLLLYSCCRSPLTLFDQSLQLLIRWVDPGISREVVLTRIIEQNQNETKLGLEGSRRAAAVLEERPRAGLLEHGRSPFGRGVCRGRRPLGHGHGALSVPGLQP